MCSAAGTVPQCAARGRSIRPIAAADVAAAAPRQRGAARSAAHRHCHTGQTTNIMHRCRHIKMFIYNFDKN